MANPRRKAPGMTPKRRERALLALNHRKDGRGYEWIAGTLGISVSTAHEDVHKALQEVTREAAEDVRQLEIERLDALWLRLNAELARVIKSAKSEVRPMKPEAVVNAVTKITDSQLKVQERRAKYLGLDSFKAEVTVDAVGAIQDALGSIRAMSDEELVEQIGEDV